MRDTIVRAWLSPGHLFIAPRPCGGVTSSAMITSQEHWATSGLLFFSSFPRLFHLSPFAFRVSPSLSLSLPLATETLSASLVVLPLLPPPPSPSPRPPPVASGTPSIRSRLPSSCTAGAKLSFDALRIRFPVEFCGDKGSKSSPALSALYATGPGSYNIVRRSISPILSRFIEI